MAAEWFVHAKGRQHGPFSSQQLKQLALRGKIGPETPVKKGPQEAWVRASRVKGLFAAAQPPPSYAARPGPVLATAEGFAEVEVVPEPAATEVVADREESSGDKPRRPNREESSDDVIRAFRIPVPAAFRNIAMAIRADIRARRKEKIDTTDLLAKLYQWAVIEDFFTQIEWNRISDHGILRSATRPFIKRIQAPYKTIGYANLYLLKKTDVKWLVEAFGEPEAHSTARDANLELWQEAVEAFRAAAVQDEQKFWRSRGFDAPSSEPAAGPPPRSC